MTLPLILILAAGASTRMRGGDKLLEPVAGRPQLARIARAALATGAPVRVALPPDRPTRNAALAGLAVQPILVTDAAEGMAASIRVGLAGWQDGVMILPADMPELTASMLSRMIAAHQAEPGAILRGASGDEPGHPVIFPADLLPALRQLHGDAGARSVIAREQPRLRLIALPGRAALTDLDTPEDWAAWRASGGE